MNTPIDPRFVPSRRARLKRLALGIINTRYFFIAFLLHVALLAFFKGRVIFDELKQGGTLVAGERGFIDDSVAPRVLTPPPVTPPKEAQAEAEKNTERNVAASANRNLNPSAARTVIASLNPANAPFTVPDLPNVLDGVTVDAGDDVRRRVERQEGERYAKVAQFFRKAITNESGGEGMQFDRTSRRIKSAIFTCYVGKYKGGDWDCNFGYIADRRWYGNCIYNLMLQIQRWTKGAIKAQLKPEVLELASRDWLDRVKPPYVFFTGHQDFLLDESEVQNLREYLMQGGALWIDSSLPGKRSRFDLAIRREMRKVLPGCDFEPLRPSHPLYTSYYSFSGGPPPGMNFYREPVEVIKIGAGGGDVAVLYTLNAYSDLWETGLTEKDKIDREAEWSPERQHHIYRIGNHLTPGDWAWQQQIFYRNVNEQTILSSYKFGINIVYYLLTRYEDRFMRMSSGTI